MAKLLRPRVYLVGYTSIHLDGLEAYLHETGNAEFIPSIRAAKEAGLSDGEVLVSVAAKLCYKALTLGQNANLTRVRDVESNLRATHDQGHGSVWEHACLNFIVTDCSRVFTHELVRHRAGTAFSQTSGRYVRLDQLDLVFDPILHGCEDLVEGLLHDVEQTIYLMECRLDLRVPPPLYPLVGPKAGLRYIRSRDEQDEVAEQSCSVPAGTLREKLRWVPNDKMDFTRKKKLTSAIRRVAPNGQPNEIFFSVNMRALRHVIMLRTGRHAEWEVRLVGAGMYELLKTRFPLLFYGAREEVVDGLVEVSRMKLQPYEYGHDEAVKALTADDVLGFLHGMSAADRQALLTRLTPGESADAAPARQ